MDIDCLIQEKGLFLFKLAVSLWNMNDAWYQILQASLPSVNIELLMLLFTTFMVCFSEWMLYLITVVLWSCLKMIFFLIVVCCRYIGSSQWLWLCSVCIWRGRQTGCGGWKRDHVSWEEDQWVSVWLKQTFFRGLYRHNWLAFGCHLLPPSHWFITRSYPTQK